MGKTVKILLGLALALPMLAYVTGSLVAAHEEPRERTPIEFVQRDAPAADTPGSTGTGPDKKQPEGRHHGPKSNDDGDDADDRGVDGDDADDGAEVIRPSPRDLDDDDDDGADDRDDDGDDDG